MPFKVSHACPDLDVVHSRAEHTTYGHYLHQSDALIRCLALHLLQMASSVFPAHNHRPLSELLQQWARATSFKRYLASVLGTSSLASLQLAVIVGCGGAHWWSQLIPIFILCRSGTTSCSPGTIQTRRAPIQKFTTVSGTVGGQSSNPLPLSTRTPPCPLQCDRDCGASGAGHKLECLWGLVGRGFCAGDNVHGRVEAQPNSGSLCTLTRLGNGSVSGTKPATWLMADQMHQWLMSNTPFRVDFKLTCRSNHL